VTHAETPSEPAEVASPPDPGSRTAPAHPNAGGTALVLAALGIVFGDIGTSPLYALQTVFSLDHNAVQANVSDVYGVISLMFWSVTLVVSVKYVGILMRADNDGEGGVMALTALARRLYAGKADKARVLVVIGIIGVSLFYGDSLITPAISVAVTSPAYPCSDAIPYTITMKAPVGPPIWVFDPPIAEIRNPVTTAQ